MEYNTNKKNWYALKPESAHPVEPCGDSRNDDMNDAQQTTELDQMSHEIIVIRDSCDITVETTDTKVAASLQGALQVAIAVVISITIADSSRAAKERQEI